MKKYIFPLLMVFSSSFAADKGELETVSYVDLNKYMGRWYEIARLPNRFEKNCTAVIATYTLREDGKVDVINACHVNTIEGKFKQSKGKAWVVNKTTNAKLKVRFFWPFSGKYWIIDLGTNYEYAVVGHPNRDYLWILSRQPHMSDELYHQLIERIKAKGYDLTTLEKTIQPD